MSRRFFYLGDVNIEHGGYFYCLDSWKWGYVDVLRVQPCSDAGGPGNCFWIEALTVNLECPEQRIKDALASCGDPDAYAQANRTQKRHMLVDALVGYGAYDQHSSTLVRIGGPDKFYNGREGEFVPECILRGNTSLLRYARRQIRHHF